MRKEEKKTRRQLWKQEKKARRQELCEHYKYAPWYIRIPRLYLVKPLIALLVIGVVGFGIFQAVLLIGFGYVNSNRNNPVPRKEIEALSPIDKEGAKRIDAAAPVDKNDTWTICLYICASDLEDQGENDLAPVVKNQIAELSEQLKKADDERRSNRLKSFTRELKENDLDMPAYLYHPSKPVKTLKEGDDSGAVVADGPGAASTDIGEMTAEVWSDNIKIVIQTGGATRWSNGAVNPNRTQRFLYYKGEFSKIYDQPLERVTDPKTLSSFLSYCKEEYPADHNMLILWNHGGGSFGYGHDSIYNGMMSLKDIREGLEGAYKPDSNNPAFDIIGFDACLMSSVEVTHALDGFASYYALSEEAEPGDGWDYTPWLKAMTKDPTMSPAKVAQEIADSYMDYYMTQNVNMGWLVSNAVTFSVLDAKKTEELYDAYCDLAKKQLADAAKDNSVLAEIGRCSNKSTHYVSSVYNMYNTIDLGNYVDHMVDTYPEESSQIKKLIGESVMYHRENGALSDSQGISVYVPGSVDSYQGLMMCLQYIYEICDDPATRALYYYKIAGCLNGDMQKYLATLTDKKIPVIDLKLFEKFEKEKPVMTDTGFEIPVDEKLQSMLQSYELEAAYVDKNAGLLKKLGRDELARLDGEGKMDCEFDGSWICLDGVPLATEVVASTASGVEYRSRVLYNGQDAYLTFSWDRDTEEFTIQGVRGVSDYELAGGLLNAELDPDPFNYLVNTRMNTELKKGDKIIPIYETSHLDSAEYNTEEENSEEGDRIKIKESSAIKVEKLPDGYYLNTAVIGDTRGDVYYSKVVGNKVSGGKVKKRKTEKGFAGRIY